MSIKIYIMEDYKRMLARRELDERFAEFYRRIKEVKKDKATRLKLLEEIVYK